MFELNSWTQSRLDKIQMYMLIKKKKQQYGSYLEKYLLITSTLRSSVLRDLQGTLLLLHLLEGAVANVIMDHLWLLKRQATQGTVKKNCKVNMQYTYIYSLFFFQQQDRMVH